jgi:hypothetical protein
MIVLCDILTIIKVFFLSKIDDNYTNHTASHHVGLSEVD